MPSGATRSSSRKWCERAEHPAHRVAQLAVGLDEGLEDLRADAQVVGIVGRRHPQAQDVGAAVLDDVLRRGDVALRLRHLLALLVEDEAVREDDVEGRAAARAAALEERGMEPAAVLVRALEIHDRVGPAVEPAARLEVLAHLEREGVRRARIEPDVEDVVDLLVVGGVEAGGSEEARSGVRLRTRRRRPPVSKAAAIGRVDALVLEDVVRAPLDEDGDRHAPGALARHHPVGPVLDHAGDAVLAGGRHPLHGLDGRKRAAGAGCPAAAPRCSATSPCRGGHRPLPPRPSSSGLSRGSQDEKAPYPGRGPRVSLRSPEDDAHRQEWACPWR